MPNRTGIAPPAAELMGVLSSLSGLDISEQSDGWEVNIFGGEEGGDPFSPGRTWQVPTRELQDILENLGGFEEGEGTALYNADTFEQPVSLRNAGPGASKFSFDQEDPNNRISYVIDDPTPEYTVYALDSLNRAGLLQSAVSTVPGPVLSLLEDDLDFVDYLTRRLLNFQTFRIKTRDETLSEGQFRERFTGMTYTLAFNRDVAITEMHDFRELAGAYRVASGRDEETNSIDPPQRGYVKELIDLYKVGVSGVSEDLQFLSFYKIMEYFFQDVFRMESRKKVQDIITDPSFSYQEKEDIDDLIEEIKGDYDNRPDGVTYRDRRALESTLRGKVDLHRLKEKLEDHPDDLIEYYKTNQVPFSGGNKVNLETVDGERGYPNLADRLYSTRNSIVHSKSEDADRFKPFIHNEDLAVEVPLMRFTAEEIIWDESEII